MTEYLSSFAAALAALIAYLAVYKNSQPQIVAYYQPSARQQSIIELVIENVGTGNAFDIKFSKPLPIGWFGIEASAGNGSYIPTSGIPSLAPRQQLVFFAGQFGGLAKELGSEGLHVDITYKFNPPLWRKKGAKDTCMLSIEHLRGVSTVKSMEQAVVDAIDGKNQTTIKDIRSSLQQIEKHLATISRTKSLHYDSKKSNDNAKKSLAETAIHWLRHKLSR